jgi:tetratricopeptide (TPR) repeat protein
MVLGNHGRAQSNLGNHEWAQREVTRALHLYRLMNSRRGVAQNLDNLGTTFACSGQYRRAIDCFLQAIAIAQEIGDTHTRSMIQHQLGAAHVAVGELSNAIRAFRRAAGGFHEVGLRRWEAVVLVELGKTVHRAGHPHLAEKIRASALSRLTTIRDPRLEEITATVDGPPE